MGDENVDTGNSALARLGTTNQEIYLYSDPEKKAIHAKPIGEPTCMRFHFGTPYSEQVELITKGSERILDTTPNGVGAFVLGAPSPGYRSDVVYTVAVQYYIISSRDRSRTCEYNDENWYYSHFFCDQAVLCIRIP